MHGPGAPKPLSAAYVATTRADALWLVEAGAQRSLVSRRLVVFHTKCRPTGASTPLFSGALMGYAGSAEVEYRRMSRTQTNHSDDDDSSSEDETLNFGALLGELVVELPRALGSEGAAAGGTAYGMRLRMQRVSADVARVWIESDAGARVHVDSTNLALAWLLVPAPYDVPAHNGEWVVSYLAAYTLWRLAFASVDDELLLAIEPVRSVRVHCLFA